LKEKTLHVAFFIQAETASSHLSKQKAAARILSDRRLKRHLIGFFYIVFAARI
jgi:hypothetical protein